MYIVEDAYIREEQGVGGDGARGGGAVVGVPPGHQEGAGRRPPKQSQENYTSEFPQLYDGSAFLCMNL